MDAEKLKVIAEGVSDKEDHVYIEGGDVWVWNEVFNPLNNAEQCMEIMEKLKIELHVLKNPDAWQALINLHPMSGHAAEIQEEGKTINEAACNAAYEHFKQL